MCSDASNGEYEDLKSKIEAECSSKREDTLSEARFQLLSDVLEILIRLDQECYFMNLLDKSVASGCTPMCFSKMQEKVSLQQYPTWSSFVDDFESICHTAMKYNPKQSEVWNAANSLLYQGRRCLEQHSLKERANTRIVKSAQNDVSAQGEKLSPSIKLEHTEVPLPELSFQKLGNIHSDEFSVACLVNASAEELPFHKANVKLEIDEKVEKEHNITVGKSSSPNNELISENSLNKNDMVNILELSPCDILRLESDKQATDCSSSFGDTQSILSDDEADGQSCEVESELRNGNGAMVLTDEIRSSNRKKKAVNLEWKTYRQGIEWRCRWLELRVKELQALSNRYDRILATAKSTKKLEPEQQESISARTSAIFDGSQHRTLRRMRRRKEEENADSKMHMSKHPVFSRYEKQPQHSREDLANEEINKDESYQILDFDDFHPDFDDGFGDDFLVEEDSIEQFLWHIEKLQMHVCRLKTQLMRGAIVHRSAAGQVKDNSGSGALSQQACLYETNPSTSSPGYLGSRSFLGGYKAQGGKSLARKRSADFDIDSVIMPDTVMANYIEPARHAFIETPNWRVLGDAAVSARGGSSEEDTDDEAYKKGHVEMQETEIQEQAVHGNESGSVAFVREQTDIEKVSNVNTVYLNVNGNVQSLSTSFGFVPRRKRRRRESRGTASVAKNIEPLLKASYEDMMDPYRPRGLGEEEDNQKTSSTG